MRGARGCLHIAQVVFVQNKVLDGIGHSGGEQHNEDDGDGHACGLVKLLGNAEERTDSQKLLKHIVIYEHRGEDDNKHCFH